MQITPITPSTSPSQSTQTGAFEQKVTDILRLTEEFTTAQVGGDVLRAFTALKKETSELYGTAFQDKTRRITVLRQQIATQEVDPTARTTALDIAELEESKKLKEKNQQAEKLLYTVGQIVIQALKKFTAPGSISLQDPDLETSIADSLHWCAISLSRPQYRCQLAHANNLLELGKISEALKLVRDLSYFFPEKLKAQLSEIAALQSEEKIAPVLKKFLSTNQAFFHSRLEEIENTPAPAPSFADLMQHGAIVETFLKYVSPGEVRVTANSRNFREITAQSFPTEYLNSKATNISSASHFSLSTSPKASCACEMVAYRAMLRNGQEFGLLSETLRRNIGIIKIAIISILKSNNSWSEKSKRLNSLLNHVPEDIREEIKIQTQPFIENAMHVLKGEKLPDPRKIPTHSLFAQLTQSDYIAALVSLFYFDEDICMAAVEINGEYLAFVHTGFQQRRDFVLKAVQSNGKALQYASAKYQNDEEIVSLAVQRDGLALKYASPELQNNKKIVSLAVKQAGQALEFANAKLRNDEEIVSLAVQRDGLALEYASHTLRDNPDIVSLAVKQAGQALCFASYELTHDAKIVSLALEQDGRALIAVGSILRKNPDIVSLAVKQAGQALCFASRELQNDEKIVALAVQQDGRALNFASFLLQNNKKIVSLAVQQNGLALCYASPEQRNNPEIALLALLQNKKALEFVGPTARLDPRVFKLREDRSKYLEKIVPISCSIL